MKLMFASDIHGSAFYCERLLEAYRREGADRLCLLGDILYHGPRNDLPKGHDPKRVAALLNEAKNEILCVRGNCDAEVDQMVLEFPVLADYALIIVDERTFFLTHGHRFNCDALPPLKRGDVLIYGHTHVPAAGEREGVHCLNTGSVALPKFGDLHTYILYENGMFSIKTLEGDTIDTYNI